MYPPPIPSWDQRSAERFLAACDTTLGLIGVEELEVGGLTTLARDSWTGPTRHQFEELVLRRRAALDDAYSALWRARSAVERAAAEAPTAILRAGLVALPFAPGTR